MQSHREGSWLGSPNYTAQREGNGVSVIVLHTMVTTIAGANARFQQADQQASANYGIGVDGSLVQWVDECDAAWHCGVWDTNMRSIGIEHEDLGLYNSPRPDALYETSAALVRGICERYGIPVTRSHILAHREVFATGCPDALDVDRIVIEAAHPPAPVELPNQPTIEDDAMQVLHTNGTVHWAFVGKQNKIMHGVWGAAQPELMQVAAGQATAIRAFFQVPGSDKLAMVVDGMDGETYYEFGSSNDADLTADVHAVWTKR